MLRIRLSRRALAAAGAALTLLVASRAAPAQITEQQALAQLKAALKTALSQFKADLKTAQEILLLRVEAFELDVKNGGSLPALVTTLFGDFKALQVAVSQSLNAANDSSTTTAGTTLNDLGNGTPLNGVFPVGFYRDDGGAIDKFRVDVQSALDKLYGGLRKRLAKSAKLVEKEASVEMNVNLSAPPAPAEYAATQGGTLSWVVTPFSLDVLVAMGTQDVAEDGRIWLAGSAGGGADVTVQLAGPDSDTVMVTPAQSRWSATLTDAATLFKKGNYAVLAYQGTDNAKLTSVVSVR